MYNAGLQSGGRNQNKKRFGDTLHGIVKVKKHLLPHITSKYERDPPGRANG